MAIELFLVPMTGDGASSATAYRSKYTDDALVIKSGTLRYGRTESAIALIQAPQAYLDGVAGQSDATRLATSSNIDQTLSAGQASAAKTIFEAAFIPGQFINAGDTRREVIRGVVGMFLFSQRMEGRFGENWKKKAQGRGVTLDTEWSDFPQALKNEFIDVRDSFGWNVALPSPSTLRSIMATVSEQFESTPFYIASFEI